MFLWALLLFAAMGRADEIISVAKFGNQLPKEIPALIVTAIGKNPPKNNYEDSINLNTLRYIIVITRHGSRSPLSTYRNDPYPYYNIKFWPDGPGQLTRYGKQQLFASGQQLRKRYNGFINTNYFPNDTAARSNPYDRDFMSAACLLAGFYPPSDYQLWNPSILWQPVPIWEEPFDVDIVTSRANVCPTVKKEQTRIFKKLDKKLESDNKNLTLYVSKHTGRNTTTLIDLALLWDTLNLQQENGFKLPKWTKKIFPTILTPYYVQAIAALIIGSPKMTRLTSGPVLENVNSQLQRKVNGTMVPDRRMYLLAAHDVTLIAILGGLGFKDPFLVDTSAYIVFELHENSRGHIVQMLYFNNSATAEPTVLNAPNCNNPCNLKDFSKMVDSVAPKNWKSECRIEEDN
ncbi:lysosomal acid phosphatase-like [Cimex lectularius]|uniref:acid phosphatase n=1 Tax=Cimex lectularius TaxID=79782 RepID=A0A8I6RW97_CIMLE|nr:lysosomal acid phosphatase-like [Cimex lectularius]